MLLGLLHGPVAVHPFVPSPLRPCLIDLAQSVERTISNALAGAFNSLFKAELVKRPRFDAAPV